MCYSLIISPYTPILASHLTCLHTHTYTYSLTHSPTHSIIHPSTYIAHLSNYSNVFSFLSQFTIFYLMAFTLIIIGVFIFNLKTPTIAKPKEKGPRQKRLLTFSWRRRKSKETASTNLLSKTEQGSEGILRGPNEPVLSSNSYTTSYSQSMSYGSRSYGSNSTVRC